MKNFDEEGFTLNKVHEIETLEDLSAAHKALHKLIAKLRVQSKKAFVKLSKKLFKTYPELKSFGWCQYTPYFMDGDPCVFFANTECFIVNGYNQDEDIPDEDIKGVNIVAGSYKENNTWDKKTNSFIKSKNELYDPKFEKIMDEISLLLNVPEDHDYLEWFGDHSFVEITKKGIEVLDYDHE